MIPCSTCSSCAFFNLISDLQIILAPNKLSRLAQVWAEATQMSRATPLLLAFLPLASSGRHSIKIVSGVEKTAATTTTTDTSNEPTPPVPSRPPDEPSGTAELYELYGKCFNNTVRGILCLICECRGSTKFMKRSVLYELCIYRVPFVRSASLRTSFALSKTTQKTKRLVG
jgi:hypothetical protein